MHRSTAFICCSLSLLVSVSRVAQAEDLKLSDGTMFRDYRVLEVRPDSLVVSHKTGVAMAAFERLPKAIRVQYGYDPRKAAAFREREAKARQTLVEENRRLVAAYEERKMALARARAEALDSGAGESQLTFRGSSADRAYDTAVAHLGSEIAQAEEARIAAAREGDTFWTAPFWKSPIVRFLGSLLGAGSGGHADGFDSEPRNWR